MKADFIENYTPTVEEKPQTVLVELLKGKGVVVSTAESFTGGNIASAITSVSGSSSVFYEGIVAYNENAKAERLGVSKQTIEKFKPVSYEVASEMAQGLLRGGNCQLGISTTGIAGPNSDESGFPIGLCFIGINFKGKITVYKFNLDGNRQQIVTKGTSLALQLAINTLKNI